MDSALSPTGTGQVPPDLFPDLERLQRSLAERRSRPDASEPPLLEQDLETAYEELRAAGEELRVQQQTIERLVESHRALRLQQERTIAILPVPVIVTDAAGMIRAVNAAAAVLAGMRVAHMLGRPIFGLFAENDRRDLRTLSSPRREEARAARRTAVLLPRHGDPVRVEVTAAVHLPGTADSEVSWLLLAGRERREDDPAGLTDALVAMATLPSSTGGLAEALPEAAGSCRRALGGAVEVSITLGSPLSPTALASTAQLAQAWDGAQVAAGEGPSITAYDDGRLVEAVDADRDERWPALRAPVPTGTRTVVAAPVRSCEKVDGVLSVYGVGTGPAPLPAEAVEVLAVTLGGVLREFRLIDQFGRLQRDMEHALASRSVIDQAKGIVMADRGVAAEQAWEHLVRLSSTQHVKVRDVAEAIVARAVDQP